MERNREKTRRSHQKALEHTMSLNTSADNNSDSKM